MKMIIASLLLGAGLLLSGHADAQKGKLCAILCGAQNAVLDFQFQNGLGSQTVSTFTVPGTGQAITFSQTTPSTMYDATGKLTYAPNNLLLNSATLSTQNVTTVAQSNYLLTFTGTGSVTLTGTSTAGPLNGTGANNRVSLPFTPTAGTLTLTVSGAVTSATLSRVTYETSPRPQDQVITGASSYFGPRFDYNPATLALNGLLIEQASTNLFTNSNPIGGTGWTNDASLVVATNNAVGPSSATDATTLTDAASATTFRTHIAATVTSGTTATLALFLKNGTRRFAFLELSGSSGTNGAVVIVDLVGGTSTASGVGGTGVLTATGIQPIGGGWYRAWITGSIPANTTYNGFVGLWNSSSLPGTPTNPSYTGNGSSIQVFGVQLEALAFPTSYIPTGASQVARAAEVVTATLPAACATQGTMQADVMWPTVPPSGSGVADINNGAGGSSNAVALLSTGGGSHAQAQVRVGGSVILNVTGAAVLLANAVHRLNVAYGTNAFGYADGTSLGAPVGAASPSGLTTINIGNSPGLNGFVNGWMQHLFINCPPLAQSRAQQNSVSK